MGFVRPTLDLEPLEGEEIRTLPELIDFDRVHNASHEIYQQAWKGTDCHTFLQFVYGNTAIMRSSGPSIDSLEPLINRFNCHRMHSRRPATGSTITKWRPSIQAIDAVISYIQHSNHLQAYTIEPINEPVDNEDISAFGTPAALYEDGAAWVLEYIQEVIRRVAAVNPRIPVMFQGSFREEEFWSPRFLSDANLVFDVHNYYFAGRGVTGQNITSYICSDAEASAGDGKFPVFVGEWSIEAEYGNTLAGRELALNTGLYAFSECTQGSAYWTAKFLGNGTVDGEGVQADYWNYMFFVGQGWIHPSTAGEVCGCQCSK